MPCFTFPASDHSTSIRQALWGSEEPKPASAERIQAGVGRNVRPPLETDFEITSLFAAIQFRVTDISNIYALLEAVIKL